MTRIKRWLLTAVVAALLTLSATTVASADPYDPGTNPWWSDETTSNPYDPGVGLTSNPYDPGVGLQSNPYDPGVGE